MISKAELAGQLSATIGKLKVLELSKILKEDAFALRDLIDISFYPDKDIAFRAAWILENVFLQAPETYTPDLEYLISRIKDVKHASCQRHYAKILMHITGKRAPKIIADQLLGIDMEPVAEQCFDWMIDTKVKIAVKVFASETLFNMHGRYPWIKEELADQLHFLMRNGSPGIQTRGRKLLALLSKK